MLACNEPSETATESGKTAWLGSKQIKIIESTELTPNKWKISSLFNKFDICLTVWLKYTKKLRAVFDSIFQVSPGTFHRAAIGFVISLIIRSLARKKLTDDGHVAAIITGTLLTAASPVFIVGEWVASFSICEIYTLLQLLLHFLSPHRNWPTTRLTRRGVSTRITIRVTQGGTL